ncbi:MAG: DNA polymerase III subunit beta [Bacillota bacterium]|nr:MAG: DNA polymerase III subunit beta [Bacillota bacterium]
MKLICDGLDLSDAVLKVGKALGIKKTNPVLEGIYLKAKGDNLTLIATDTELTIEKTIRAEVLMEGETVVTGKYFSEFVKKLENEQVELSLTEENLLRIKYSDSESEMQCFSAEEFPKTDKKINENFFVMKQSDFKRLINMTVFSCSQDDSRPILKGVLFEIANARVTAVALDGFRLALARADVSEFFAEMKAIIPSRTLGEIVRLLAQDEENVKITLNKNTLMVENGGTTLISRLLEGEFINYKQIIPTEFVTNVRANAKTLSASVERASVLARTDRISIVKFDIKENVMYVIAKSEIGNVNEPVPVNMEGKDVLIAFNSKYITEFLKIADDEFINFHLNSPIAPCVIKPLSGDNYLYLVLPVRINA